MMDRTYLRAALTAGGLAALVVGGLTVTVGEVSGLEAGHRLEASLPTVRFLASSVMTAAATTLALLLTLLGLGRGVDQSIDRAFYGHVRDTARLAVGAFVAAVVLLTSLVLPFTDEGTLSPTTYTWLYYGFTVASALVAGALVAVVVSLYRTLAGLIETLWFDRSPFAADDEADEPPGD